MQGSLAPSRASKVAFRVCIRLGKRACPTMGARAWTHHVDLLWTQRRLVRARRSADDLRAMQLVSLARVVGLPHGQGIRDLSGAPQGVGTTVMHAGSRSSSLGQGAVAAVSATYYTRTRRSCRLCLVLALSAEHR